MIKFYLQATSNSAYVLWEIGDEGITEAFSNNYEIENPNIVDILQWLLKSTPIQFADELYIDCKEFKLVDTRFWQTWGVNCQIKAWDVPKKT